MSEAGVSFPEMEEKILEFWNQNKIFEKSIDPKKKAYSFYDGPPFATGLPHYGHLLASTLKDIVPRYWTMKGYCIERRWGWDCHGLPIEQEIDKKHHFKSTTEIEEFGIAEYNEECRGIVTRFAEEWEKIIGRLGRWVDYANGYRTMDRDFMESVWWVFHELWKKDLIYRGYKSMQFSTALGTPLSNFEAGSNYQEVQDPAITVEFPIVDQPDTHFLAWTTTPWTLPANLMLAVGKEISYATVKKGNKKFILAENLVEKYFKKEDYEILETKPGSAWVGTAYLPLFSYFADLAKPHFTVQIAEHVTTEDGTGIVHTAPGHGEEDFQLGKQHGLKLVCPVDSHGTYTNEVSDFKGQYVKDADKEVIAFIKKDGRLFKHDTLNHRYAFCPRTDTPLISLAVPSWFVSVEKVREQIQKNNQSQTHWVPEHLRDGRFGKWLENARDWAISRNRFWGNPLPIWEAFEEPIAERETFCIGSVAELEKLTGKTFDDLHRHHLDDLIIEKNGKKFKRVPEVLDCWFESGSMPYAQYHYPFENQEKFARQFPADFIAEGLDQTRGWFYTLSVLGTILFDKIPFKNVVVNGMILAEDGKKMSKRLKNYPDPQQVMRDHGADALRLYLIDSPVIRAEELRFSEKGVREIVRKVILKLWNAHSFLDSYAKIDGFQARDWKSAPSVENILDRWIISRLQSLLKTVEVEMERYHLFAVVPPVLHFIEELTNTYIRLNRSRFWSEGESKDKDQAFCTLHYVLTEFTKVLAPFAPFISEEIFQRLTEKQGVESVHLENYPIAQAELIDAGLESGVRLLEEAILLGRNLRETLKLKVRLPLKELVLVHRQQAELDELRKLEPYIQTELNVRKVSYSTEEEKFVNVQVKPNAAVLGPKAGKRMKEVMAALRQLSFSDLQQLDRGNMLKIAGDFEVTSEDVKVQRDPIEGELSVKASSLIAIALDTSVDADQEQEGLAREVVNRIQNFRKDSGLELSDRILLEYEGDDVVSAAISNFSAYIAEQCLCVSLKKQRPALRHKTEVEVEGHSLALAIEVYSALKSN